MDAFKFILYTSAPDKIQMLGRFINKMNIEHLTVDKKDINTIEGGLFNLLDLCNFEIMQVMDQVQINLLD